MIGFFITLFTSLLIAFFLYVLTDTERRSTTIAIRAVVLALVLLGGFLFLPLAPYGTSIPLAFFAGVALSMNAILLSVMFVFMMAWLVSLPIRFVAWSGTALVERSKTLWAR